MYEIHISEHPSRDGMFLAASRIGTVSVKSRDPEHDICYKLMKMGYADGPVLACRTPPCTRWGDGG